jgi:hypothetical protein
LKLRKELKMSELIKVPFFTKVDAGIVGTAQHDVFVVEVEKDAVIAAIKCVNEKAKLIDIVEAQIGIWEHAKQHAESYGIYEEAGVFLYEDDSDLELHERYCYDIEGQVIEFYEPSMHDDYRVGGGSFLEEPGAEEAYNNFLDLCIEVAE